MAKVLAPPLIDLLNKCDEGQRVMLFMVPLRIIRVLAIDTEWKTFRVEQLVLTNKDPSNPKGNWSTLSTHSNPVAGQAYPVACEAAAKAQNDLRTKLQKKMAARQPKPLLRAS